jgi:adenylate cyclase
MDRRRYIGFALAYVLIPVGVNGIVASISFSIIAPLLLSADEVQKLNTAMQSDDFTLQFFSYMSFIFPTSIGYIYNMPLIIYMFKKERPPLSDKIKSIIINLPIVNATVSFAGWGLALLGSFLNFQNNNIHFGTMSTIKYSLFNFLMANLCFVFVYYIMDMVNKNFIRLTLVGEHLSEIPKTIKVSIRSRFFIFYITVAVTPCILLVDLILSILNDNQINGYYPQTAFVFLGIIFIGTVLTFFISHSFANPIRELETATSQLQLGNLDASVIVNSNDEIGFLGERFNEMSLSIKEKEFIKDTFGKVVDPTVRDYLLRGNLALGGETRDVSDLFTHLEFYMLVNRLLRTWLTTSVN